MENKDLLLWVVISILAILVIYVVFFKGPITGNSVSSGKIDTSGWTDNEIMNYEMHGTIPTRFQGNAVVGPGSSSSPSMVGGC